MPGPAFSIESNLLTYKGSNFFKQRLLLATLSGKAIKINEIRSFDAEPGIRDYEMGLINLLLKITNGTVSEVNKTGTALYYRPGFLFGGTIQHDCSTQRGIGESFIVHLSIKILINYFS